MFSLTAFLIFVNSAALKTQVTSKWIGSNIVTQAQCVIGDYNSDPGHEK